MEAEFKSMSKTNSFLSEIVERKPIPSHKLAYFQSRLRHNLYDFIISKFEEMEAAEGLTKAELARRTGCKPELITRRLGAPGNWTLDTISDLLIGISGEELDPQSKPLIGRAKRNSHGRDLIAPTLDEERQHEKKPSKPKGPSSIMDSRPRGEGRPLGGITQTSYNSAPTGKNAKDSANPSRGLADRVMAPA